MAVVHMLTLTEDNGMTKSHRITKKQLDTSEPMRIELQIDTSVMYTSLAHRATE